MTDDFSRSIARVAASQIAEASGFDACQDSAIEILADLLLRYLSTICASSHSYAELAGRSQSNLADVLLSLEELGVTADDLHQHLELQKLDVPFAHTLAPYPVRTQRAVPPTFAEQGEQQPAHIPSFLPAFPDPHTYQHTAAYAGHEGDPYKQRQSMLEAKQKAEAALNKLHQRMSSKATQPDVNPFMIAPAVEQLPVQLPAAAAAGGGRDQVTSASAAAAGTPAAEGAAAANGAIEGAAAVVHQLHVQQGQTVQQLQQQQQLDEEDALFEQATMLKAFSSIVAPELVRQVQGKVEVQQQIQQQQDKQQQEDDIGVVEEQPMDVDGAVGAADAAAAATWLGWKQVQHQGAPRAAAAAAANAVAEAEVLRFGIDSLAASKRAALSLTGRQGPADVYAQQMETGRVTGVGGGSRQRKSKYDADPKLKQAEGILGAGPEAVFDAVGVGMHSIWDTGADLELV